MPPPYDGNGFIAYVQSFGLVWGDGRWDVRYFQKRPQDIDMAIFQKPPMNVCNLS